MPDISRLFEAERKLNLDKLVVDDIWVYPLIKMGYLYSKVFGAFAAPSKKKSSFFNPKIISKNVSQLLRKDLNPILLVDSAGSRRFINGNYINAVFSELHKSFDISLLEFPQPEYPKHYNNYKNEKVIYADALQTYSLVKAKLLKDRRNYEPLKAIIDELSRFLDLEIPFDKICKILDKFFVYRATFIQFLKLKKYETIFLICAYTTEKMALVSACKSLKIPCIEIQHGNIHEMHLGYIYQTQCYPGVIPDYLLTYGSFFTDLILSHSNYFTTSQLYEIGNLNALRLPADESFSKKILISSQWIVKNEVLDFTIQLAKVLGAEYQILFKPHPRDTDLEKYTKIISEYSNIELVDKSVPFKEIVEQVSIHSTVYSTTFFESIERNKYNILLDIDEHANQMKKFVNNKTVFSCSTAQSFVNAVISIELNHEKTKHSFNTLKSDFFKENPLKNITSFINSLKKIII